MMPQPAQANPRAFRRYKRHILLGVVVAVVGISAYLAVPRQALSQADNGGEYELGTVEAIPGQVVEREYWLPTGEYVRTVTQINPGGARRYIDLIRNEIQQKADRTRHQASPTKP
jgi:hypothetical protein